MSLFFLRSRALLVEVEGVDAEDTLPLLVLRQRRILAPRAAVAVEVDHQDEAVKVVGPEDEADTLYAELMS